MSELTSTQIGAIAENLIANEIMIESGGRLSPFQPIADDDGLDVLIYDKVTGKAAPVQIKARTNALKKKGSADRGNVVHFEVKKSTFRDDRPAFLLCVLLKSDLRSTECSWLMPLQNLAKLTSVRDSKYVIRANKLPTSNDKYQQFRCSNAAAVCKILIEHFEN